MSSACEDEGLAQQQGADCQVSAAKPCWMLFGTGRFHQDKAIFFFLLLEEERNLQRTATQNPLPLSVKL